MCLVENDVVIEGQQRKGRLWKSCKISQDWLWSGTKSNWFEDSL